MCREQEGEDPFRRERIGQGLDRRPLIGDVLQDVLAEHEIHATSPGADRRCVRQQLVGDLAPRIVAEPLPQPRDAGGLGLEEQQVLHAVVEQALRERADPRAHLDGAAARVGRELLEHPVAEPARTGEVLEVPELLVVGRHGLAHRPAAPVEAAGCTATVPVRRGSRNRRSSGRSTR